MLAFLMSTAIYKTINLKAESFSKERGHFVSPLHSAMEIGVTVLWDGVYIPLPPMWALETSLKTKEGLILGHNISYRHGDGLRGY